MNFRSFEYFYDKLTGDFNERIEVFELLLFYKNFKPNKYHELLDMIDYVYSFTRIYRRITI